MTNQLEAAKANGGYYQYDLSEKRLAVAAYLRYGATVAARVLEGMLQNAPTRHTLAAWSRDPEYQPDAEQEEYFARLDLRRKTRLQAEIAEVVPEVVEALRAATAERKSLQAQQFAFAMGILYDKVVPPPGRSGGVTVQAGEGGTVQMLVVAPTEIEGVPHREVT